MGETADTAYREQAHFKVHQLTGGRQRTMLQASWQMHSKVLLLLQEKLGPTSVPPW